MGKFVCVHMGADNDYFQVFHKIVVDRVIFPSLLISSVYLASRYSRLRQVWSQGIYALQPGLADQLLNSPIICTVFYITHRCILYIIYSQPTPLAT